MKVKDVIVCALNNLGRQELAGKVSSDVALDSEGTETVNTLLYCFNAVEDEIARCYLPLLMQQTLSSTNGQVPLIALLKTPIRIRSVMTDGEKADYKLYPQYIKTSAGSVTIEYEYSPSKKTLSDTSDYEQGEAGEYMFACGMAAEYCLINGEVEAAELWESRYRQELDAARKSNLPACAYIPPRRWV